MRPAIVDPAVPTFARWIIEQKRRSRPGRLFVAGITGSIGRGKTTFCRSLIPILNEELAPEEGRALTRSLDDYYLPKAERYTPAFLSRGYNPPGISNRGPAGTHDLSLLKSEMDALEKSSSESVLALVGFDKQTDDRTREPIEQRGKVGVLLFEGWFVGASTKIQPEKTSPGLKHSVALALPGYRPFFNRLDALWAFKPTSLDNVVRNRLEQQKTLDTLSGKRGMMPEQIRRFVQYFYEDSWEPGVTSPVPPDEQVFFWADVDEAHQIISLERGGRLDF